jgi:hypothetical protein
MVLLQSRNAAHAMLYGKACSTFSLAGGAEGFSSTSISPEGSVTGVHVTLKQTPSLIQNGLAHPILQQTAPFFWQHTAQEYSYTIQQLLRE